MADTFSCKQWQAYMAAELGFSRRPSPAQAAVVIRAFHAWGRIHLTLPQFQSQLLTLRKELQAHLINPLPEEIVA